MYNFIRGNSILKKRNIWLVLSVLCITLFALNFSVKAVNASAVKLSGAPSGLIGKWTTYKTDDDFYNKVYITRHHVSLSPYINAKKATWYKRGYHKYTLAPSGMQPIGVKVTTMHSYGKKVRAIIFYVFTTPHTASDIVYKAPYFKKPHFKIADSTDFFYNAWRSAYLSEFSTVDLYKAADDAVNLDNSVKSISNPHTHFYARWLSENENGSVLKVKYRGQTYYADNSEKDLVPYNAEMSDGQIYSYFKPTSKSVILKKGTNIRPGASWDYSYGKDGEKSIFYDYTGKYWRKDSAI